MNASDESEALVGLDKATGKEVWRAEATGLSSTWATPILMDCEDGKELVIAVPGEIWGLDPKNGKLKWFAEGFEGRSACPSLVAGDGVVYCPGTNPFGGAYAVRTGGKDNVTESHVLWTVRGFTRIRSIRGRVTPGFRAIQLRGSATGPSEQPPTGPSQCRRAANTGFRAWSFSFSKGLR